MSWILTFIGISTLVILHELGHFAAAKSVGMRVERFSLFFGPAIAKVDPRRDRVPDRHGPARGLREDLRDEPRRRPARGSGAPQLLPPARVEARPRDRGGTGDERARGLRDPLGGVRVQRRARRRQQRAWIATVEQNMPRVEGARTGRRAGGRGRAPSLDARRDGEYIAQIAAHRCAEPRSTAAPPPRRRSRSCVALIGPTAAGDPPHNDARRTAARRHPRRSSALGTTRSRRRSDERQPDVVG